MNNDEALSFLLNWSPKGPWVLTAVDPERKARIVTSTFDATTQKECLAFISYWNAKRNLYFMVNDAKQHLGSKAKKEHVGWLRALHVDIDPTAPTTDDFEEHYENERRRILGKLSEYAPEPSVIIFSGGGYGAFWLLKEPIEIDSPERFENYNRQIEKELEGDHCHNIDRIMRLPGTINLPDAKKRAKGRVAVQATILSADWDRKYELNDFREYAEERKVKKTIKDDWVDRVLHNGPDHEGPRSYGGDRSKALWAVCLALVRRNCSVDEIIEAILDKQNKLSEHVYDQNDPKRYARKQAEKAYEEAVGDFTFNEKGQPHPTQDNVRVALSSLEVRLSYDEFANRVYIEGPDAMPKRKLSDSDADSLYLRIARDFNFRVSLELWRMMIKDEAIQNTYHPLKDYLNSLKWDGKKRIDTWLIDYAGVKDIEYTRAVGAIFFIAAVRRVNSPGCKYDEILVLEGPQGYNKSSALAILAIKPEWFTDSLSMNSTDKQIIEALEGKWIVEVPELKGLRNSQVEHQKAMLSRQYDRARLSYGHFSIEVPRQCTFSSSTNTKSYLTDPTGNRRFWPNEITKPFDLDALRRDVDQLWAEAVTREAAGESIRLHPDLYPQATLEQARRKIDDPWESVINKCLNGYEGGKILSADLWEVVNMPVERRTQRDNERLGGIMQEQGWERKKLRFGGEPQWGYAKGTAQEQAKRISIDRDQNGNLHIERDGDLEAHSVQTWNNLD